MKPKIVLTFVYLLLIILLVVLIVQKYGASVTGKFYFVGGPENVSFNPECNSIRIIASSEYNKLLTFKNKTVYININLIDKLQVPERFKQGFLITSPPLLYSFNPRRKNIVIIGDSYSQGADVSYTESYPYYLSKLVNANIINLGKGGYNTKLEIERLFKVGMSYHPELIIWQLCGNDMEDTTIYWSLVFQVMNLLESRGYNCKEPLNEGNKVLTQTSEIYYKDIFPKERKELIKENIVKPLLQFQQLLVNKSIPVILIMIPQSSYLLQYFPDYFKENITILDMEKEMGFPGWRPPFTVSKDKIHFSARTNKELAEVLAKKIKEVLK